LFLARWRYIPIPTAVSGKGERFPGDVFVFIPEEVRKTGRIHLNTSKNEPRGGNVNGLALKFLNPSQVRRIDDLLSQLGEYGELHLIIQHGELRYINKVESYKAWKTEDDSQG
jgi:hypothetical protein